MKPKASEMKPFRPYHPGELLKEELECRNIKQKDFAEKTGLSYTAFNEVLNGKRAVTAELALIMETVLGINADMLLRMQTDYNLQSSRENEMLINRLSKLRKIAAVFL